MPPKIKVAGRLRAFAALLLTAATGMCLFGISIVSVVSQEKGQEEGASRRRQTKPELGSKGPQENPQGQKGYTIGVNVDLVVMHTSVYDKAGRFVGGLKKDNFKVFEDGVEQKISSFSQEDVPVSMGILLDLSGSMRNKIEQVNKAALAFIRASNPQDQEFLIGFNEQVELLQDYTSDIDEVADSLDNIIVTGGTALYDAIYLGVQKAHTGIKPKKAIVVITDGEDRDSYYKLDELVAKVQESDVQIFCVGFLNPVPDKGLFGHWSKSVPEKAHDALQKISEETGGKAFFPQKLTEINNIVSEIAHDLRNQYSIGYVSSNTARDGSYRRVKITLDAASTANNHLRYRRGYTAPKTTTE
ncbi:MAG TPA: VWA domain-containing protein [Acidobacteriota bacterium]|nr:VWA domain-containing protein [Acidobacteriota bacterium]